MNEIEIGYVLPARCWVAQDETGSWCAYEDKPVRFVTEGLYTSEKGFCFIATKARNPFWQDTLHQIQPGEIIYLSD